MPDVTLPDGRSVYVRPPVRNPAFILPDGTRLDCGPPRPLWATRGEAWNDLLKLMVQCDNEVHDETGKRVTDKQFGKRLRQAWAVWQHYAPRED